MGKDMAVTEDINRDKRIDWARRYTPFYSKRKCLLWQSAGSRRFYLTERMIGFPPKKIDQNVANLICNRYWDVVMKRSKLRWEHTSLSADWREFARRWA